MKQDAIRHICVLKTGKLFEHDLAASTLKERNIPFYQEMETSTGLRLAMPFQPAMGPGDFYSILVPEKFADRARELLEEIGIETDTNPGSWDFGPTEKTKNLWSFYIWVILAATFVMLALSVLKLFL